MGLVYLPTWMADFYGMGTICFGSDLISWTISGDDLLFEGRWLAETPPDGTSLAGAPSTG